MMRHATTSFSRLVMMYGRPDRGEETAEYAVGTVGVISVGAVVITFLTSAILRDGPMNVIGLVLRVLKALGFIGG